MKSLGLDDGPFARMVEIVARSLETRQGTLPMGSEAQAAMKVMIVWLNQFR